MYCVQSRLADKPLQVAVNVKDSIRCFVDGFGSAAYISTVHFGTL
jgi:hypothetical protein